MNTRKRVRKLMLESAENSDERKITNQTARSELANYFWCFGAGMTFQAGALMLVTGESLVLGVFGVAAGVTMYLHITRLWREVAKQSK